MAGISGKFRVLFGAVFGFFYAPLVITGLHHMSNAIDLQLINSTGGTMLWPMIALSNIAQGAAVAGMSYLQKKNTKAREVNIPSMISCWLGVTEPAMFGINLKYQWPFYCAMTGSCLAAVISTLFSVTAASIGVGGLPGIISIFPKYMFIFAIAMLVALVVPFVLTVMIGRTKINPETGDLYENDAEEEEPVKAASFTDAQINETFAAPVKGRVMPVSEVEDQVFASKAMGDGIAIDPAEGKIYAPFSGEITVAFPTGHAYGIKAANGKEVLIHIGMDTVELNGKGFTPHVKQGDIVRQGDLLTDVDLDYIRSQGKPVITPVIFTDGTPVEVLKTGDVAACEKGIIKLG
jgi:PTS system trehalose-specific IIC component